MQFKVPTVEEIKILLLWGILRLLLTFPLALLYCVRQSARLISHTTGNLEQLYSHALIKPFDALLWSDARQVLLEAEVVEALPASFERFDWNRFKSEPDAFPHIRLIGKSGMGKTRLAEYLLSLLGGNQYVITPKRKASDWRGLKVYGTPFNYDECSWALNQTKELMYRNYQLLEQGLTPEFTNFAVDEWRSINQNVASAKETIKEIISVARDAKVRLVAIAQGEQVNTWGLQGESDLEECFTTIRLGEFAIDYARSLKLSNSIQSWLKSQRRPCMVGRMPAEVPDLSNFQSTSLPQAINFQLPSEPLTENDPGRTAKGDFQPLEGLPKGENFELENAWKAHFYEVFQGVLEGKTNYAITKNAFELTGGSTAQKIYDRIDKLRTSLSQGEES